ncbi:unnamed protein product, partial [Polarella glacialis]
KAILAEAGRFYAPWMVANAAAVAQGAKEVRATLEGKLFVASSFPYQAKCLRWLREEYAALSAEACAYVDEALDGTGFRVMFEKDPSSAVDHSRL